jgi:hypothetical protein
MKVLIVGMQDKELYSQILGISSSWKVSSVITDMSRNEVRRAVVYDEALSLPNTRCQQMDIPCSGQGGSRRASGIAETGWGKRSDKNLL